MSTENPYQSPQANLQPPVQYEKPPERTLGWTLFAFDGRIPRRVYWGVTLGTMVIFYAIMFALMAIFGEDSAVATVIILLLDIPVIWISLAVQIKRWHDRDKSGFWVFINLIPIIGGIWALIEVGCLRGTVGPNQYGPDPT
jgi:uncharacterized membrane protein YhaH (DUF805 family)